MNQDFMNNCHKSKIKSGTIAVLPEAKKMLVAEVKRLRGLNQYANEKMLATNAIYAFLGKNKEGV